MVVGALLGFVAITGLGNDWLELGGFAGINTVLGILGVFGLVSMGTAIVVPVGAGEMEVTGNDGSGAALAMGLVTGDREAARSIKPLTFARLT